MVWLDIEMLHVSVFHAPGTNQTLLLVCQAPPLQEPRQKPKKKKTKWRTTSHGSYVYEPQILRVATNQPITLSTCLAGTVVGQHGKQLPTADIPVSNYHTGAVFKRSHDGPAPPMVTIVAAGAWRGRAQKQGPQP